MNTDNFDLVERLLTLPWYNLILISLLIIPLFIGAWGTLLSSLSIALNEQQKKRAVLIFIGIYSVGLIVGKIGYDKAQVNKVREISETLKRDLESNGGIMGFKRIRERHPSYSEDMLYKIAERFSKDFQVAPIADPADQTRRDQGDPFGLSLRNSTASTSVQR